MSISINGSTGISGVDGDATTPALQGGDVNTGVYFPAADQVAISTNGSGRLFVDANGRIGVATTTPKEVIDARGAAVFSGDHATAANAYDTAHGIMLSSTSGLASVKAVSNGANDVAIRFIPLSAGSGSEAARITPDGKLGLGTSAPENLIHADFSQDGFTDGSNTSYSAASSLQLRNTNTDSANSGSLISFRTRGTSGPFSNWYVGARNEVAVPTTSDSKGSSFKISQLTASATGTVADRLVISTSGNVGIGTTPSQRLHVGDTTDNTKLLVSSSFEAALELQNGGGSELNVINSAGSGNLSFRVSNSEKMRMDSSGRLLVGTSTSRDSNSLIQAYKDSGNANIWTESASLANNQQTSFVAKGNTSGGNERNVEIGLYKHAGITNPGPFLFLEAEDGANRYYWTDNSDILRSSASANDVGTTNGTVIGTQTSDGRLKDILGPVEYGLDTIKQIEPVCYSLKSQPHIEQLGFVAQQVQPLVPQSVFDTGEHIEGEPEDAPTKLGMEYVALIPVLVNAIKELSAKVETLEAEVQALKGGN